MPLMWHSETSVVTWLDFTWKQIEWAMAIQLLVHTNDNGDDEDSRTGLLVARKQSSEICWWSRMRYIDSSYNSEINEILGRNVDESSNGGRCRPKVIINICIWC
jgi:hypothetical protein